MKKCQSCKHHRPDMAFKDDKADFYAYCAAPKAMPPMGFADYQRIDGRVMAFLFSTCGEHGRWHEPQS